MTHAEKLKLVGTVREEDARNCGYDKHVKVGLHHQLLPQEHIQHKLLPETLSCTPAG